MISIKKHRHIVLWGLLTASIVSAGITAFLLFQYRRAYTAHWEKAKKDNTKQVLDASNELVKFIDILKPIVHSIAEELSKKELTAQEIEELLQKKKIDEISSVGVAFAPYAFTKQTKLFGRAVIEKDDAIKLIKLEDLYDYTEPSNIWFHKSLKDGTGLLETYKNKELNTTVAEYSVPIYRTDA